MAAPNGVALAALVYNLSILEEGHPVCDFEVTLCNIGFNINIAMIGTRLTQRKLGH